MLLSEYVEVLVVGGTLEYYREIFGDIIQCKDIIKVHVSQLPKTSKQIIQVKCDTCGKIVNFHFDAYSRYREDIVNAKYECRDCEIDRVWNNVLKTCDKLNYNLLNEKSIYVNQKTRLEFICNNHNEYGIQNVSINNLLVKHCGCKLCANEKKSLGKFINGITPLHNYLRSKITAWIKESIKYNNYKCCLTNLRFDVIHHLYGFNLILSEVFSISGLPIYESVNQYTEKELELLEKTCIKLHFKYGYGVCLIKELHDLFHQYYSCGNNTTEQFEEFTQRYKNYEFDDLLEDKYKYKNVILKEVS